MREISEEEYNRLKEYEKQKKFENALVTAFGISAIIVFLLQSYNLMLNSKTLTELILSIILLTLLSLLLLLWLCVIIITSIKKLRKGGE